MEPLRQDVQARIVFFEHALTPRLSSLLREQISDAIVLYKDALRSPNINVRVDDLDACYDRIEVRWARIFKSLATTSALLIDVSMLQRFLAFKILEDYMDQPYRPTTRALGLAQLVASINSQDALQASAELPDGIILALEESKLDAENVLGKLRAVGLRRGTPRNDLHPLVETQDWEGLAAAIRNDRKTVRVFDQTSQNLAKATKSFLNLIDTFERKYLAPHFDAFAHVPTIAEPTYWLFSVPLWPHERRTMAAEDMMRLITADSKKND